MIHDLSNLKRMQETTQKLELTESVGSVKIKEEVNLFSKLQIGDVLQGELIIEGEQPFLKLESDLKLPTNLPVNLLLNRKLDFQVVGKESGRLLLECIQTQINEKESIGLVNQALRTLQLKDTSEMRQMIEQFIDKQLPLVRDKLINVMNISKKYEIPTQVLTNLISKNTVTVKEELELLTHFKEQGIQSVRTSWEDFIDHLSFNQSRELTKRLFNTLTIYEIKHVLQKIDFNDLKEEQSTALLKLKEMISSEDNIQQRNEQEETLKKLDQLLKGISFKQLSKLNKAFIEERVVVHLSELNVEEKNEVKKITELSTRLKQIVEIMKAVREDSNQEAYLSVLEKNIEVLDQYKIQGEYFYFPLEFKEQHITGELYFFRPKKNKKQQEYSICVVLALSMPALHKIEVHLIGKSDGMTLKIKVENESIKEQLAQHETLFLQRMEEGQIPLKKVEIELLNEKDLKFKKISNERYGLDLKI